MPARGMPSRISEDAFKISTMIMLAIALVVAFARSYIRISTYHHLKVDDIFFYIAVILLIVGTSVLYKTIPLIFLISDSYAGLRLPPLNPLEQFIKVQKLGIASTVVLSTAIFSIKLSFLFFFRYIIWQSKRLSIWWWTTLVVCLVGGGPTIFSSLIQCAYFDERIFSMFLSQLLHS